MLAAVAESPDSMPEAWRATTSAMELFAFIVDGVMVASAGGLWRDGSFAIGSTLVVAFFFGIRLSDFISAE